MNNLTKQLERMEVNRYKQLQHGLKNALNPQSSTTPSGITYVSHKASQNSYKPASYYDSVFSSNVKKSRKSRKGRKSRKVTRKQRK
jgi:hypothetical protein